LIAEFCWGIEEDGFVDEVLAEERAVEVRTAFEEDAEDVAFGESGEDGGEAEASVVVGDLVDFHAEGAESGSLGGESGGTAEDEEV